MNLSFSGCGFMGVYHVGVCTAVRQHAPWLYQGKPIAGASAGALIAACLITEVPMDVCLSYAALLATKAREHVLGPLNPSFNIVRYLREGLDVVLPDNAHEICTNRLHISLTRVWDRKNVLVSEYRSKQDLLQALLCSAFIPFYCGLIPPEFRGERYMDGSLSDNLPILNNETITVAPFAGESDICPDDKSLTDAHVSLVNTSLQCSVHNLFRLSRALFPPGTDSIEGICRRGYDDALRYLYSHRLITCVSHSETLLRSDTVTSADSALECEDVMQRKTTMASVSESDSELEASEGVHFALGDEEQPQKRVRSDSVSSAHNGQDCTSLFDGWRCMAEGSAFGINPNCADCRLRMQLALHEHMPQRVIDVLRCASLEQSLRLEFLKQGYPSLFQLLTMPYVVPLEYTIVISKYFLKAMVEMNRDLRMHGWQLIKLATGLVAFLQKQSFVRVHYEFRLLEYLQSTGGSDISVPRRHSRPLGSAFSSPVLGDTVSLSPNILPARFVMPAARRLEFTVDFEAQARDFTPVASPSSSVTNSSSSEANCSQP